MGKAAKSSSAMERILNLLDSGSFVEIGTCVQARNTDFNLQSQAAQGDGVITGYGTIGGNLVYAYSQDVTVLNGTIGEMHAKKICYLYDFAMKMGAPIIGFLDCGGMRLQEATDTLNGFGSVYLKQVMASGVVPQIVSVMGMCGGGLTMVPALSDFTFMEKSKAKLFINSPNAVRGNTYETCDTSSGQFRTSETGMIDFIGQEAEILEQIRLLIGMIPANNQEMVFYEECTDDLNRTCETIKDIYEDGEAFLRELSDHGLLLETKKGYARSMVTGFIRLNGMTVGAVANRSKSFDEQGRIIAEFGDTLTANGCKKAAEFVNFCDAFSIPIVSAANVTGYKACKCTEKQLPDACAKMIYAFANATVPKISVITGKAYGTASVAMNSKSIGADLVYAWSHAEIGMMEAELATKIMYPNADAQTLAEQTKQYRLLQSSPEKAANRGYVDALIEPEDTRKYIIAALEMLITKKENRPSRKHGTV